jgi:hypothetical protein
VPLRSGATRRARRPASGTWRASAAHAREADRDLGGEERDARSRVAEARHEERAQDRVDRDADADADQVVALLVERGERVAGRMVQEDDRDAEAHEPERGLRPGRSRSRGTGDE